ncbi:MAG: UvrB/UvrC motif-containing protein [Anaerococcus sp.]|nr:UvrB/UvrC motif-containing protein [Anaerococcus sp.]
MKCDKCGKEANVNVKTIVNGKEHSYYLCSECAKDLSIDSFDENGNIKKEKKENFHRLMDKFLPSLDDLIDSYYDYRHREGTYKFDLLEKLSENTCPKCGNPISNIREGNFGCDACYKLDERLTERLLKTFNNYSIYEGKYPKAFRQFKDIASQIKDYQEKLNQSVDTEDYERAAKIKDKLDKLNMKVKH